MYVLQHYEGGLVYQYIQSFTPNTGIYPKYLTLVGIPLLDPHAFSMYALNLFIYSRMCVYVRPADG